MAPPENSFAVSELENRVHLHTVDYKEKSRKLPRNFDLKRDCELFEMVQYSCSTPRELEARPGRMECYPFVRLFRK